MNPKQSKPIDLTPPPHTMPLDEYRDLIKYGIISERLLALGWGAPQPKQEPTK